MIGCNDPRVVIRLGQKLPYFFGIEIYQAPTIAGIAAADIIQTDKPAKEITHRPRGMMCELCIYQVKDCSALPFERMRVVGKDADGLKVVVCDNYTTGWKK